MQQILLQIKEQNFTVQPLDTLAKLIDEIRPPLVINSGYVHAKLVHLADTLANDPELCRAMGNLLSLVINESDPEDLFLVNGLQHTGSIYTEVTSRLSEKILGPLVNKNSLSYKLNQVFDKRNDYEWLSASSTDIWTDIIGHIIPYMQLDMEGRLSFFANAIDVLSIRLAAIAARQDFAITNDKKLRNAFIEQLHVTQLLSNQLLTKHSEQQATATSVKQALQQCADALETIKADIPVKGTSLQQTYIINSAKQLIDRLLLVVDFVDDDAFQIEELLRFIANSVYNLQTRKSVRTFLSQQLSLIAYQIAENKSEVGEHYIAKTRSEFGAFFLSACGGGLIVSVVVLLKYLIHYAHVAPFWEAILFSLNYSLGFIAIQVTGSTLATKQPAMTASAIAASMDGKKQKTSIKGLAITTARIAGSQTISFAGNLLVVFPMSLILYYVFTRSTGITLVHSVTEAKQILTSNHPLTSLSLLYAAFTGVFLFLSGIISGYVHSRSLFGKIPERIRLHFLNRILPYHLAENITRYLKQNLGSLAGNFALGFFLGTAAFIGFILGIPYDIRHITIASGNYIIGLFEAFPYITLSQIWIGFWGVLAIGFVNFLVSFSLALYVAIKSRNISLSDYANYLQTVVRYFFRYPADFLFPPTTERKESDLD